MSNKFKAIVIDQKSEKFSREIKELETNFLDQGDVLVKVDYSDLNYKDALILNDGGKLVRDFPRIPGIDFSGKVLESNAEEFKKDEEVILTGCRVGEMYHGGYSQLAKVKKDFLIKKPKKGKISSSKEITLQLKPSPKLIRNLRKCYPDAFLVGWKYEVSGDRKSAVDSAKQQINRCKTNLCVANGPAYGNGFGVVSDKVIHCANNRSLFRFLVKQVTLPR